MKKMADKKSSKRSKVARELAQRVAVSLSVRALWAVIVELFRNDL
ncbi:hypothetical protein [Streptomyces sp. NBC_01187]|nr:hypothetical protein OG220_21685 [Streptomyces sp. NBC_01187]